MSSAIFLLLLGAIVFNPDGKTAIVFPDSLYEPICVLASVPSANPLTIVIPLLAICLAISLVNISSLVSIFLLPIIAIDVLCINYISPL